MIGVVTDSAASLDPALISDNNIVVVPLQLQIGGAPHTDADVAVDDLPVFAGDHPPADLSTAGPSPAAFMGAIELADEGDGVVVLTVSRKMSSTHEAAMLAARLCESRVEVIDTGTAAGAEGLVVLAAARTARAGGSLDAVIKRSVSVAQAVRLVAEVGDLRPLGRGGRLPGAVATVANAMGLRPVFEFRGGAVKVLRPALSPARARQQLLGAWRDSVQPGRHLHVTSTHAHDRAAAEALLAAIRCEVSPATCFVGRFSPVVVTHTGPDILGLAWWWDSSGMD